MAAQSLTLAYTSGCRPRIRRATHRRATSVKAWVLSLISAELRGNILHKDATPPLFISTYQLKVRTVRHKFVPTPHAELPYQTPAEVPYGFYLLLSRRPDLGNARRVCIAGNARTKLHPHSGRRMCSRPGTVYACHAVAGTDVRLPILECENSCHGHRAGFRREGDARRLPRRRAAAAPRRFLGRYFRPAGEPGHYQIRDEIRSRVEFAVHDVLSLKAIREGISLIVCRERSASFHGIRAVGRVADVPRCAACGWAAGHGAYAEDARGGAVPFFSRWYPMPRCTGR